MSDVLTVDEAAGLAGCAVPALKRQLQLGLLPAVRLGRGWSIPRAPFVERLAEMAVEQAAARRRRPPQGLPQPQPRWKRVTIVEPPSRTRAG